MSWNPKGLRSLINIWPYLGLAFYIVPDPKTTFPLRAPARAWLLPELAASFLTTAWCHFVGNPLTLLYPCGPAKAWVLALAYSEVPPTSSSLDLDVITCQPLALTPSCCPALPLCPLSNFSSGEEYHLCPFWDCCRGKLHPWILNCAQCIFFIKALLQMVVRNSS